MYTDHWVNRYLQMKWKPDYNCFHHFCHVQKMQFNRIVASEIVNVPEFEERSEALRFIKEEPFIRKNWLMLHENIKPKEGDAVIFGSEGVSFHIGTYVESGTQGVDRHKGILHNSEKYGVVFTGLHQLRDNSTSKFFMRYHA